MKKLLTVLFLLIPFILEAQPIDTISKGTPLYPGWQNRINLLIDNYNQEVERTNIIDSLTQISNSLITESQRKLMALENSDGKFRIWLDSATGDDANDGTSYFKSIRTLVRLKELVPTVLTGIHLEIIMGPGTYSDGFDWNFKDGHISITVVDSTHWEVFKRTNGNANHYWGTTFIGVLAEDALARDIDTAGWNPFTQQPIRITSTFRIADLSRLGNISLNTYYVGTTDWPHSPYNPAGRLVFRDGGWLILECGSFYHERSHLTFDMNGLTTQEFICGLWINRGFMGGMAFFQDSTKMDHTAAALRLETAMPQPRVLPWSYIPLSNLPNGKHYYFKNVRRLAQFYGYHGGSGNFISYLFHTNIYESTNPNWPKPEIVLRDTYQNTLITDTSKVSIINLTTSPLSISYDAGSSMVTHNASHLELALGISGTEQLRGQATIGASDSVQVTLTGVLPTDYITLSYQGALTPTKLPTYEVFSTNTLTIYGDATRVVNYIRIK